MIDSNLSNCAFREIMEKRDIRDQRQYDFFDNRVTLENASNGELINVLTRFSKIYQEPYKGIVSFTAGGLVVPGITDSHSKIVDFWKKCLDIGTIPSAKSLTYNPGMGQLVPSSLNIPIHLGSGLESRDLYKEAHRMTKLGGRECQIHYFFQGRLSSTSIEGDFQRFIEQCFDDPYGYQISGINLRAIHKKDHPGYKSEKRAKREIEANLLFDNSDRSLNFIIDTYMRCERPLALKDFISSLEKKGSKSITEAVALANLQPAAK